jgi:hypothetical protein
MAEWPYDHVESLTNLVAFLEKDIDRRDVLGSLRCIGEMNERLSQAAIAILEIAAVETKIPQSQLAGAVGVPASTLRGLRRK